MKRVMVIVAMVVLLLFTQVQTVFAEEWDSNEMDFIRAFFRSDLSGMESALLGKTSNTNLSALLCSVMSIGPDTRFIYSSIELLIRYGVDLNSKPPYYYFRRNDSPSIYIYPGGTATTEFPLEILVHEHSNFRRSMPMPMLIQLTRLFLEAGADMYYHSELSETLLPVYSDDMIAITRLFIENGYNVNRSRTSGGRYLLFYAAGGGQIATVRLLVEAGARVNQQEGAWDTNGKTAAQRAYESGHIDIYNYLKANGAVWTAPSQVASAPPPSTQQPRSTYNDTYDYTPPPSSSGSSRSSGSSTPDRNIGREIADAVSNAFQPPLDNGTYRMSGGAEQIVFAGIARGGNISYKDAAGTTHRGTYSIDGTRLTINVMGRSYFYTITSKTSFSGNGESWFRVGF